MNKFAEWLHNTYPDVKLTPRQALIGAAFGLMAVGTGRSFILRLLVEWHEGKKL